MAEKYGEYKDEFGLGAPIPASHGQRRMASEDFSYGPLKGERVPDFILRGSLGTDIDFHKDRGASKAALVFVRSAVW